MTDWKTRFPNFSTTEVECKCCNKNGIDEDALDKLQELRDKMARPLNINSGFRCTKHNAEVGGGVRSMHLEGKAFDVSVRHFTKEARLNLVDTAAEVGFTGFGFYDTFLHIDTGTERFWGNKWK